MFRGYTGELNHPNWVAAVKSTTMEVINAAGRTGLGLYSSSSGGRTESFFDAFGSNEHPYLAVVDDRAAFSDLAANPHAFWAARYPQATLADIFGFSWLVDAEVTERNDSGSARTVRLIGVIAGRSAETSVTGNEVREALSLRSTTFDITTVDRFDDVPPLHQFSGEILGLSELGITAGCTTTTYCPDRAVTRGEMAAFLVRGFGLETATDQPFADTGGHFFEAEIGSLAASGITSGLPMPWSLMTRANSARSLFFVRANPGSSMRFLFSPGSFSRSYSSAMCRSGDPSPWG